MANWYTRWLDCGGNQEQSDPYWEWQRESAWGYLRELDEARTTVGIPSIFT